MTAARCGDSHAVSPITGWHLAILGRDVLSNTNHGYPESRPSYCGLTQPSHMDILWNEAKDKKWKETRGIS